MGARAGRPGRAARHHTPTGGLTTAAAPFDEYLAPWWLPGGDLQTIWGAKLSRRHLPLHVPRFVRQRWTTPDGDFIDVDQLQAPPLAPAAQTQIDVDQLQAPPRAPAAQTQLVLFHGLEGTSASAYAQAFASLALQRGWGFSVPHFRGCSGELNLAPRAYHSGDYEEVGWILQRLRQAATAPLLVVGISLGGNALLRWAQEAGASAAGVVRALAAVSAPIDLAAAGHAIDRGINWAVYSRMFLATMKPKALAKWQQHPGLFDRGKLAAARTIYAFDDVFTAPLHGFRDTPDYWARASAKPHLERIQVPALVLNARNDPFVPAAHLPRPGRVGRYVTIWQPSHGGHVGFPQGRFPGRVLTMPQAVADWLAAH